MSLHTRPGENSLAETLTQTWRQQGRDGFLLSDLDSAEIETHLIEDESSGVLWRYRWMPHREIRGDVCELQQRGILNPDRDESKLYRDPRDAKGRHCFLCPQNIAECHPMERLVEMTLAGRKYYAGANFAWIEPNHFTVFDAEHVDQAFSRHALEAAVELHRKTRGEYRVLFNGAGAGASIPWHMHFQITTETMPIESLSHEHEADYPTVVRRFDLDRHDGLAEAHDYAVKWVNADSDNHTINLLITTIDEASMAAFIFPRDSRHSTAEGKGLVGGFEVSGDFCLSAPAERETFDKADARTARNILSQIHPPELKT